MLGAPCSVPVRRTKHEHAAEARGRGTKHEHLARSTEHCARSALRCVVPDVAGGHHENDVFGDVRGVVADPLEVA